MGEGRKRLRNTGSIVVVMCIIIGVAGVIYNRKNTMDEIVVADVKATKQEILESYVQDRQFGSYCYAIRSDDTVEITTYLGSESIIYIPLYIEDMAVTSIGSGAFKNNGIVERIYIPRGVTEIKEEAFAGCPMLQDIYISETVKCIGERAMADCPLVEEIVFPKELIMIEAMTCWGDTGLKQITIQQNVLDIADDAFIGCEALCMIYGESEFAKIYAQENDFVYVDRKRIREEGNMVW